MIAPKVIYLIGLLAFIEAAPAPVEHPLEHNHPYGHSLKFLQFNANKTINPDYKGVNDLFMHPEVKDRKIAVVSIVGTFRGGKSFFMNYCLRFMYANVSMSIYEIYRTRV